MTTFDGRHPPSLALMDECVKCGFCLPACPTYQLWGVEADSPRGRIDLMRQVSVGRLDLRDAAPHFDQCLGCLACMTACPTNVQYDQLIETTRAQVARNVPRGLGDRLFRAAILQLFPYPTRLARLRGPLALWARIGPVVQRTTLYRRLPARLRAMASLVPPSPPRPDPPARVTPAVGPRRARVGLVLGCVQREFFGATHAATVRVLAAEGCDVVAPEEQGCCGALDLHSGGGAPALRQAKRLIRVFERAEVDVVVVNAAGCGAALKEYGRLLRDHRRWADRAAAFSAKVRDVAEYLDGLPPRASYRPLPLKVAYHDACHLRHAQRVVQSPRTILRRIPELALIDLAEPDICCGSAGVYNLLEPAPAEQLGDRKAALIVAASPNLVASGNPGCALQLRRALARAGHSIPIVHPVELLDASLNGTALPRG